MGTETGRWGQHESSERSRQAAREAEKARLAVRQLERAEDHIVAAINLELEDPDLRYALHRLRRQALEVRDLLSRPRLA